MSEVQLVNRTAQQAARLPQQDTWHYASLGLTAVTAIYATLAGLRTVADFDSGWLLASGRFIVQHHTIPSTDVLSYTANGNAWMYPAFSGVLFYLCFVIGGYAALSWLGGLACAGTVTLTLRWQSWVTAVLAIVAVPAIAFRTLPRAELFSTALFAATLAVLWKYFQTGSAKLWLLPVFMLFWVNLHLGFISGLGLLGAYVVLEFLEFPFAERRRQALGRLRRASPWFLGALAATLLNPWGFGIYKAVWRQQAVMGSHNRLITEWSGVRFNLATMAEALDWRNPNSGYWWLLVAALVVVVIALFKKQFGVALLVTGAAMESIAHIRFQALFAIVLVVVGGTTIEAALDGAKLRFRSGFVYAGAALWLVFLGVRISDVVTSRVYLANGEISVFGAGASWWLPERAAEFLLANRLPANVFHDYDLGGYLAWRIGPQYPVYIDGRAIPFGTDLLEHHSALMAAPPDSTAWQVEADRRRISVLFFSTARYAGLSFPLVQLCQSTQWKPVYLDDVAIVAVRDTPANQGILQSHALDCMKAKLSPPSTSAMSGLRSRAELYNFYANSGAILYLLNRDQEAWAAYRSAQALFDADPNLHLSIGQLLEAEGKTPEAEQEYRHSIRLRATEVAWYALARLLARGHRYDEALAAVEHSADLAIYPANRYQSLGQLYLFLKRPNEALGALGRAEKAVNKGPVDPELEAKIFEGQAQAYRATGNLGLAVERQKLAVNSVPGDMRRRQVLDELVKAQQGNAVPESR